MEHSCNYGGLYNFEYFFKKEELKQIFIDMVEHRIFRICPDF
jgi:hypothetical protein